MKLDSEDYQNIYLRVRDKFMGWLIGAAIALFGFGITAAYLAVRTATEAAVEKYIRTDAFAKEVARLAVSKIESIEARTNALDAKLRQQEDRAIVASELPIAITERGLVLSSKTGGTFAIETGEAKSGDNVAFSRSFASSPTVLLIPTTDRSGFSLEGRFDGTKAPVEAPARVDRKGFRAPGRLNAQRFAWIAIGK